MRKEYIKPETWYSTEIAPTSMIAATTPYEEIPAGGEPTDDFDAKRRNSSRHHDEEEDELEDEDVASTSFPWKF